MPQNSQLSTDNLPFIVCLCPTYGRFERLRDAVACFLLQDYPAKRLLILNDAPEPVRADELPPQVSVLNRAARYPTLGQKRQALLQAATASPTGELAAHWDDDDLYLPWHLAQCVRRWEAHPKARCVKPRSAWFGVGPRDEFHIEGPRHNIFEGQMLFERRRALELGGYPPKVSGQARALLDAFRDAGELHTWEPRPEQISYIYRWADGAGHVSSGGDNPQSHSAFAARNRDFGDARPLVPSSSWHRWAERRTATAFRRVSEARNAPVTPLADR